MMEYNGEKTKRIDFLVFMVGKFHGVSVEENVGSRLVSVDIDNKQ